jgi:hypothetical protein
MVDARNETPEDAFVRGVTAGELAQWRKQIDSHFVVINGSQQDTADELREIRMLMQRLTDAFESSARTEIAKASALKTERESKAEELKAALSKSDQNWTPLVRVGMVLAALLALFGIISWFADWGVK